MWFTLTATYDNTGFVDYLDAFNDASDQFDDFTVLAGARMEQNLVDMSARSGFAMIGARPKTTHQSACEYYNLDWESGEHSTLAIIKGTHRLAYRTKPTRILVVGGSMGMCKVPDVRHTQRELMLPTGQQLHV